jgi:deoxyribodipyrimidine photo-lyase
MTASITLFWFRRDLRIADNPGLFEAAQHGAVLPVYILDIDELPKIGSASRWWLHYSLNALNESLGNKLNVYVGRSKNILLEILQKNAIQAVYWNRCYEPWRIVNDSLIKTTLKNKKIECKSFNGSLLWEPWDVLKKDKTPYKVFTPFYTRGCLQARSPRYPLPKPKKLALLKDPHNPTTLEDLELLPKFKWDKQMKSYWDIGEHAAKSKLIEFLDDGLQGYKEKRNYPFKKNVSRLSPHLHFGEISPNQAWHGAQAQGLSHGWTKDSYCFLSELGWREFSHSLLYHFPDLPNKNFQQKFDNFPWANNPLYLKAWQVGQTGYPIVDAGMRELWQTGYMHNRVRMIVGSFLVKNLLQHWHHGCDWFWDCLVDADLANNSSGWQWIAGSGADAAPYFRIFNPVTQGEKFDPDGQYTRSFVPELNRLPNKYLFKPWEAPENVLKSAGVVLGGTYPNPIVDVTVSRNKALEAYKGL